ncbi:MAG: nuclear transport factor 2 family protein [Deltaproteobacteria bacterium]|nr:nuclear transport factor 2 family protein [Deltaproteobacteria bacterium]
MIVGLTLFPLYGCTSGKAKAIDQEPIENEDRLQQLQIRIEELENKIGIQEDIEAIRTLMYTYTYYMDRALFSQVLDLFSENTVSCEAGGRGVYLGKEGCRTLWMNIWGIYGGAEDKFRYGALAEHYVTKLVITVAPDRQSAKSRGHYFSIGGVFNRPEYTSMQTGIYRLDYVKEDGVWKISKFWLPFTTTGYNFSTWSSEPGYSGCPSSDYPPDEPTTFYHPFPEVYVVPFHYPNPVTGQEVPQNGYTDPQRYWLGNWPEDWAQCGVR